MSKFIRACPKIRFLFSIHGLMKEIQIGIQAVLLFFITELEEGDHETNDRYNHLLMFNYLILLINCTVLILGIFFKKSFFLVYESLITIFITMLLTITLDKENYKGNELSSFSETIPEIVNVSETSDAVPNDSIFNLEIDEFINSDISSYLPEKYRIHHYLSLPILLILILQLFVLLVIVGKYIRSKLHKVQRPHCPPMDEQSMVPVIPPLENTETSEDPKDSSDVAKDSQSETKSASASSGVNYDESKIEGYPINAEDEKDVQSLKDGEDLLSSEIYDDAPLSRVGEDLVTSN